VNGASLGIRDGSITALIGPNGAGKTTFFNVITGFYRPDGGSASFGGRDVLGRPPYAIARLGMVRTFQITKALARMPVIDNMMLGARDQPGERLVNVLFRPGASRGERRSPRGGDGAARDLQPHPLRIITRARSRVVSGSCSSSPGVDGPTALPALDEPMAGINPTLAAGCSTTCNARAMRASPSCSSSTTWRW
jgi:branched-chain amino acid transport system ATP-binding protein